jgi:hypothetical protein
MLTPGIVEATASSTGIMAVNVGRDAGKQIVAEKVDQQQHRDRDCR